MNVMNIILQDARPNYSYHYKSNFQYGQAETSTSIVGGNYMNEERIPVPVTCW